MQVLFSQPVWRLVIVSCLHNGSSVCRPVVDRREKRRLKTFQLVTLQVWWGSAGRSWHRITECGDADVFWGWGYMRCQKKNLTNTALKPTSRWNQCPFASKPPCLKYRLASSSERKRHQLWKKESNLVSLLSCPLIVSSTTPYSPPFVSLPQTLLQWMHDTCFHHINLNSQLLVESWNTSFSISCSLILLSVHFFFSFAKLEKKIGLV